MTYEEFKRIFGRARAWKGLAPYAEPDVRVFYDELKGYDDADIIYAFEQSKQNTRYFSGPEMRDTIEGQRATRKKPEPAISPQTRPELYPTPDEVQENIKRINQLAADLAAKRRM